jgi:NAD(P)-dependent dehydrogenase (short-subunit alcohol dehydrogenase family)
MKTEILKGKVIVIAGGLGRIGTSFAKSIIENSGAVVIADICGKSYKKFIDETLLFDESKICFSKIDITSVSSISDMIKIVSSRFGKIDAFVNTAYPQTKSLGESLENLSYEYFCESLNIHLGGYFLCMQQFTNYFLKQGFGNIINISSIQGVVMPKFETYEGITINGHPMTSEVDYTCNKVSIVAMTKYFAKFYKNKNIRYNIISPGGIIDSQPDEFVKRYKSNCINKGMLNTEDLNAALLFLLSDGAKYCNGQNIIIDDGFTL